MKSRSLSAGRQALTSIAAAALCLTAAPASALGPTSLGAFTIGDQLLWGAAEPLRRMLRILLER